MSILSENTITKPKPNISGMKYTSMIFSFVISFINLDAKRVPPNIIIILADDLGFGDVDYNCDNSTGMCAQTPNLSSLAKSEHSVIFHRFYATAGICSPTRASILTGRNNQRDCIEKGLGCDAQNPAEYCAMAKEGGLPMSEFTFAKAAKKSHLGQYSTLHIGKWHLGDLWEKHLPGEWMVSAPWNAGFDEWLSTEAETSNSMSNCGCFPKYHPDGVDPKPPHSNISEIYPWGDECIVGGGMVSDWCYPCTNYYYANSTDERNVTDLKYKVPADDSLFIMDRFENFAYRQAVVNERPFLAYLCLHALHEPHSTLPEFYNMYSIDSEYLGAITQMDNAIGSLISILKKHNIYENTIVIFTSDNGPRQGSERSDVLYSTGHMRQCKKSIFEGGLRVPAIVHAPYLITTNRNITAPVGSVDILPTLIELLQVESDNPTWIMDGISLLPYLVPQHHSNVDYDIRPHEYPLTFWYLETSAIIDNNWKLIYNPEFGTINCAVQPPYDTLNVTNQYLLFDLHSDIHEITDLKNTYPIIFQNLKKKLNDFQISVNYSQHFETRCYLWHNFSHSNL